MKRKFELVLDADNAEFLDFVEVGFADLDPGELINRLLRQERQRRKLLDWYLTWPKPADRLRFWEE